MTPRVPLGTLFRSKRDPNSKYSQGNYKFVCILLQSIEVVCQHSRAFEGPADEDKFLQQALLFGEMIQADQVDAEGVDFSSYFSVQNISRPDSMLEEVWFITSK